MTHISSYNTCTKPIAARSINKILAAGLLLLSALIATSLTASAASNLDTGARRQPARLLANIVVTNRLVTLGDLFENADPLANKAVFRSPSIGQSGTIRAERVVAAAKKAGLNYIDTNNIQIVSVQRDSQLVTENDIMESLKGMIRAKGYVSTGTQLEIEISTHLADQHAAPNSPQAFKLHNLHYDRLSGRFTVALTIGGRPDLNTIRLAGKASETVMAPVMTRSMRRGEIVTEADITMARLPKQKAQNTNPATIEAIIGMAVREPLRAGMVANASSFTAPNLVNRSDIVTMMFKSGSLTLSMRGKALTDGAKGDVISVQNQQSNRIIHAEIVGPGLLQVTSPLNTISALGANLQ